MNYIRAASIPFTTQHGVAMICRHVVRLIVLALVGCLHAAAPNPALAQSFEEYKEQRLGNPSEPAPQKPTNISEDLPLDNSSFGSAGKADEPPSTPDIWRPTKDAANKAQDLYESSGSPKHITGPDGSGHGVSLTVGVSESTIGAPCDVGSTRCENGQRMVCRSSLEGKRMAYWWEFSGTCDTAEIGSVIRMDMKPGQRVYREIIDYKMLYEEASESVVLIYAERDGNVVSKGTGSLISSEGLVLTNAHVVDNSTGKIDVYFKPAELQGNSNDLGEPVSAVIVAIDRRIDLALLSLNSSRAFPAPLALSDLSQVGVGEPTIAIGHPTGGAFWSLTTGRVSGSFTNYDGIRGKDVFQTETAMNPGNSGGPLLDGSGQIIGVNSFIRRQNASGLTLAGLNFAIKSTSVQEWIDGLSDGTTDRDVAFEPPRDTVAAVSEVKIESKTASRFVTSEPAGREFGGSDLKAFLAKQKAAFDELDQIK